MLEFILLVIFIAFLTSLIFMIIFLYSSKLGRKLLNNEREYNYKLSDDYDRLYVDYTNLQKKYSTALNTIMQFADIMMIVLELHEDLNTNERILEITKNIRSNFTLDTFE